MFWRAVSASVLFLISPVAGFSSNKLVVVAALQGRRGFVSSSKMNTRTQVNAEPKDPTKVWYAEIASGIQNILVNSPLKDGKKALVKSLAGEYDDVAVRARLDGLIESSQNGVLMLSFTTCPFCLKAKNILQSKNAKYEVLELDIDEDGKAIRAEMADILGRTSVPAIWIGGEFIGGCNDGPSEYNGLNNLNESGKLDDMLSAVGAI